MIYGGLTSSSEAYTVEQLVLDALFHEIAPADAVLAIWG